MNSGSESGRVWRRRISPRWVAVLAILLLVGGTVGGISLYYPAPQEVLAAMWPLRTRVLAAVRSDSPEEALPSIKEWDQTSRQLLTALRLSGEWPDGETRQRIEELRESLAALRTAIENHRRDEIASRALACFEAHRLCAALFDVAPPASARAGHDHGGHAHVAAGSPEIHGAEHAGHQHGRYEIGPDEPVPAVRIDVKPDLLNKGWNLRVETENFRFAPGQASGEHVPGEGHAHLYVDGKKVTRLYGEWHFLGTLAPGPHTVRVTLNTNDHDDYVHRGEIVAAETTVEVPVDPDDPLCRYPLPMEAGPALAREAILFGSGDRTAGAKIAGEKQQAVQVNK